MASNAQVKNGWSDKPTLFECLLGVGVDGDNFTILFFNLNK